MSIKLRLEKGAIVMQAVLEDAAFAELLTTIQNHECKDHPPAAPPQTPPPDLSGAGKGAEAPAESTQRAKGWLALRSASEVLNEIGWKTNSEKILLLAAHFEAKGGQSGWKNSDIGAKFTEAREGLPGNFSRDISSAVKEGIIAAMSARTYCVSRSGWNKVAEAISSG